MKALSPGLLVLCVIIGLTRPVFADSGIDAAISAGNWLTTALEQISAERMLEDITTLSGPTFQGRQTGSAQDAASAEFVANRFSELRRRRSLTSPPQSGTNPLPLGEWKQSAPVTTRTIDRDLQLTLTNR